jgi:hypothetical protein
VKKFDPFIAYIVDRLKAAAPDPIPASVLYREIKARGYSGGATRAKQCVRTMLYSAACALRQLRSHKARLCKFDADVRQSPPNQRAAPEKSSCR